MGIDFRIGEAVIKYGYGEVWVDVVEADPVVIEGIANFEPESNYFRVGYSAHADMIHFCNGKDVFNQLIPAHPARVHLNTNHLLELDLVIEDLRLKRPDLTPRFFAIGESFTFDKSGADHLARLLRFRYWIAWALENCQVPTLYNW